MSPVSTLRLSLLATSFMSQFVSNLLIIKIQIGPKGFMGGDFYFQIKKKGNKKTENIITEFI